jgi:uncharacterized protein DUF4230
MSRRLVWALLVVAAIIAAFALWILHHEQQTLVTNFTKPREEEMDLGTLVTRVRALNRLETATMRVVHIGTISQSYQYLPNTLAGDELTLYSVGDVVAGIDLSQLKPTDVTRDPNGTIVVKLPPPQILISRVDNKETRVISRKTGMFRREDPQLESHARQYAEQSIRAEALNKGILAIAAENGQLRVADLLHTFGFRQVRVVFPSASPSRG